MVAKILNAKPKEAESINEFWRRRLRQANEFIIEEKIQRWSNRALQRYYDAAAWATTATDEGSTKNQVKKWITDGDMVWQQTMLAMTGSMSEAGNARAGHPRRWENNIQEFAATFNKNWTNPDELHSPDMRRRWVPWLQSRRVQTRDCQLGLHG